MLTREDLEYIRNYYKIDYGYRKRLKNLRARVEISSPQFDRIAGTGQHERDLMAEHAAAVDELEREYFHAFLKYRELCYQLVADTWSFDPSEMEILQYRYLESSSWKNITKKMHCSERTCFRLHSRAVQRLCGEEVTDPDPDDKDEDAAFMDDGETEVAAHGEMSSVL